MPLMRVRLDAFQSISAKLFADHFQLFIKPAGAENQIALILLHQRHQKGFRGLAIAAFHQLHNSALLKVPYVFRG